MDTFGLLFGFKLIIDFLFKVKDLLCKLVEAKNLEPKSSMFLALERLLLPQVDRYYFFGPL